MSYIHTTSPFLVPEVVALVSLLIAASFAPKPLLTGLRRASCGFNLLFAKPIVGAVGFGMLSLATNAAFVQISGVDPLPSVHDEFSYSLMGDTFASGRLTNPSPPLAEHFESYHILVRPTYQSKYPPLQGLFLAFGQLLTGKQIVGVWLSHALATGAVYWMLRAWTSPRWSTWGTLLFLFNDRLLVFWGQTFWGGAAACLGGALVFGAIRRLADAPRYYDGLALGVGCAVLANTRPVEGFIAVVAAMVTLAVFALRTKPIRLYELLIHAVVPLVLVMIPTVLLMLSYNHAVTGSMWKHPYMVWMEHQNASVLKAMLPGLGGRKSGPPNQGENTESPPESNKENSSGDQAASPYRSFEYRLTKLNNRQRASYLPGPLMICVIGLVLAYRRPWSMAVLVIVTLVEAYTIYNSAGGFPHYTAPVAPLIILLVVQGFRQLNICRIRYWHCLGALGPFVAMLLFCWNLATIWMPYPPSKSSLGSHRRYAMRKFTQVPGADLVFVSYVAGHHPDNEWVYNSANLENQSVIWAKSLTKAEDDKLVKAFPKRLAWQAFIQNRTFEFVPRARFLQELERRESDGGEDAARKP